MIRQRGSKIHKRVETQDMCLPQSFSDRRDVIMMSSYYSLHVYLVRWIDQFPAYVLLPVRSPLSFVFALQYAIVML